MVFDRQIEPTKRAGGGRALTKLASFLSHPEASLTRLILYVAFTTLVCCNDNMQKYTDEIDAHEAQASEIYTSGVRNEVLEAMFQRRAIKAFEPVEIPQGVRERILDAARHAPSSFNMQPYRFIWVESPERRATAAKLCMGQMPAETASALVVAVADIGSF